MKTLLTALLLTTSLFANEPFSIHSGTKIDDLDSIKLRVNKKELYAHVHYPNYRIGGGTGPGRLIVDCFVLDIIDSDNEINLDLKQEVASKLIVGQGYDLTVNEMNEITPEVKDNKIVFKTNGALYYVTTFGVAARDGRSLKEVLDEIMPASRRGNTHSSVNLLYVRDCRL